MTTKERSHDLTSGAPQAKPLMFRTIFGTPLRTELLVLIAGLERSYPRELARLTDRPISMVQKKIEDLELAGLIATRMIGRQREVQLNPDYIASQELAKLLSALLERDPNYRKRLTAAGRRRPRRTGKEL
jgi:hypothetical protein